MALVPLLEVSSPLTAVEECVCRSLTFAIRFSFVDATPAWRRSFSANSRAAENGITWLRDFYNDRKNYLKKGSTEMAER